MEEQHRKQDYWSRPVFVGGLTLAIVTPLVIGALLMGMLMPALFMLLMPVMSFLTWWGIEQKSQRKFTQTWDDEPFLEVEELPTWASSTGLVVQNILQAPGKVVYSDGALTITPVIGKETVVTLAEVQDFSISAWFNGGWKPGRYGVMVTVPGKWRLGFTVDSIEPWRSILTHRCESKTK